MLAVASTSSLGMSYRCHRGDGFNHPTPLLSHTNTNTTAGESTKLSCWQGWDVCGGGSTRPGGVGAAGQHTLQEPNPCTSTPQHISAYKILIVAEVPITLKSPNSSMHKTQHCYFQSALDGVEGRATIIAPTQSHNGTCAHHSVSTTSTALSLQPGQSAVPPLTPRSQIPITTSRYFSFLRLSFVECIFLDQSLNWVTCRDTYISLVVPFTKQWERDSMVISGNFTPFQSQVFKSLRPVSFNFGHWLKTQR